jgi:hypothetical protein
MPFLIGGDPKNHPNFVGALQRDQKFWKKSEPALIGLTEARSDRDEPHKEGRRADRAPAVIAAVHGATCAPANRAGGRDRREWEVHGHGPPLSLAPEIRIACIQVLPYLG